MKHMDMKCLIVASLIAAPAIAGNSSSKSNKVTTSIREIETEMSVPLHEGGSKSSKASDSSQHVPEAEMPSMTNSSATTASPSMSTSTGKSGKSDRTKSGKQSEMSMPEEALSTPSYNSSKSGKVGTAFGKSGKIDTKAFKGKGSDSVVESKSFKTGKASKDMSMSLAYNATAAPTSAPTTKPTEATAERELYPISLCFEVPTGNCDTILN